MFGASAEVLDILAERERIEAQLLAKVGEWISSGGWSGTVQLTVPLARRSLRITGLELGPGLATIARRNLECFETVEIVTGAFEAWDPGDQRFDAVIAATCWH